eukprot:COSAG02_NODE_41_length_47431_cov_32.449204_25_plen_252_part_00
MRGRNRDIGAAPSDGDQDDDDRRGENGGVADDDDGGINIIVSLAMDKFGSRVVESLYGVAELKRKRKIVGQLAACKAMLEADFHGRITLSKCRVSQFAKPGGEEEWAQREASVEKKRAMFADILADDDDQGGSSGSSAAAKGDSSRTGEDEDAAKHSTATKSILGQLGFGLVNGVSSQDRSAGSARADADEMDDLFGSDCIAADRNAADQDKVVEEELTTVGMGKPTKKKKKAKKEKKDRKTAKKSKKLKV